MYTQIILYFKDYALVFIFTSVILSENALNKHNIN